MDRGVQYMHFFLTNLSKWAGMVETDWYGSNFNPWWNKGDTNSDLYSGMRNSDCFN